MASIEIRPHVGRVRVEVNGHALADTEAALELSETGHPPVLYLPRADVEMAFLVPSDLVTHCPLKGEARHYSGFFEGTVLENVAWSYETPLPEAAAIAGRLAFYPGKVAIVA